MNRRRRNCDRIITLNNIFRKLWEQHVMWTRSFIISTADNLGDLDVVTQRLLRNPSDFAAVLKPYYGDAKANRFQKFLEDHLLIAADLVNQAKSGNTEGADAARKNGMKMRLKFPRFLRQ